MKQGFIVLVVIMAVSVAAGAQSLYFSNAGQDMVELYREGPVDSITIDAGVDLVSKYVWRGVNRNDDFVLQPNVAVHYGKITGIVWGSFDTTDEANDASNEFTEARYVFEYGTTYDEIDIVVGYVFYDFPNTDRDETSEVFARAQLSNVMFKPALDLYLDLDEVDGAWWKISGAYVDTMSEVPWRFDVAIGYGSEDFNSYYFGVDDSALTDITFGVSTELVLYENIMLTPYVDWTLLVDGNIKDASEDDSIFYGGARVSIDF